MKALLASCARLLRDWRPPRGDGRRRGLLGPRISGACRAPLYPILSSARKGASRQRAARPGTEFGARRCGNRFTIIGAAMYRLTRYILRQSLGVTLFVTAALSAAIWLAQSLRLIDLIVNRGLSIELFLYLALLLLPRFLDIVLPLVVFKTML